MHVYMCARVCLRACVCVCGVQVHVYACVHVCVCAYMCVQGRRSRCDRFSFHQTNISVKLNILCLKKQTS